MTTNNKNILLEVKNLKQYFPIRAGFLQRIAGHIKAADGVSFQVHENQVLGLVDKSGKTAVGCTVLGSR